MINEVLSAADLTRMMKELLVAFRSSTNMRGAMIVEPSIRYGSFGETATTFCTHDFSDPTTWYQRSVLYPQETPTTEDNFQYQLSAFPVINADSFRLYGRDFSLPMPDSSFVDRGQFRLQVKVGEENVEQGDVTHAWSINFTTGLITFKNRIPNDEVVTVTYHAVNFDDPYCSKYILKAPANKMIVVEHLELQFSETVVLNDEIIFELWAAAAEEQTAVYGMPQYINSPLNPWRQTYRCAQDFINNGNEGQGTIPAFGGNERGTSIPVVVFPFKYIQAFPIESKYFSELHIYLEGNKPYTETELATCSFYTSLQNQQE